MGMLICGEQPDARRRNEEPAHNGTAVGQQRSVDTALRAALARTAVLDAGRPRTMIGRLRCTPRQLCHGPISPVVTGSLPVRAGTWLNTTLLRFAPHQPTVLNVIALKVALRCQLPAKARNAAARFASPGEFDRMTSVRVMTPEPQGEICPRGARPAG